MENYGCIRNFGPELLLPGRGPDICKGNILNFERKGPCEILGRFGPGPFWAIFWNFLENHQVNLLLMKIFDNKNNSVIIKESKEEENTKNKLVYKDYNSDNNSKEVNNMISEKIYIYIL